MAALPDVQTIDMVNGEITKVAYGGAEYAKVDGKPSEVIKIGDIALCADTRTEYFSKGSYYMAKEQGVRNVLFGDNLNDRTAFSNMDDRITLFRKISAQASPTITEVSAKVDVLAERVTALEGGKQAELQVGDRVEIVDASDGHYEDLADGDISEITDADSGFSGTPFKVTTEDDYDYFPASALRKVAEKPKPITEGDIVVITANTNTSSNSVGDTGKVVYAPLNDKQSVAVSVPGGNTSRNYTKFSEMRHATPSEIAEYEHAVTIAEADAKQAAIDAKLAQIFTQSGRKPNEYRKGDIVRFTEFTGAHPAGTLAELSDDYGTLYTVPDKGNFGCEPEWFEIVAFVESRLDRN